VHPGYPDLNGLDAFAAKHREVKAGQGAFVDRLTGFCLLVRREVLDKIGGFDERYGIGFFDDDDLCLRARDAGFKLVVANDVYIHHFGSRTFNSLGVDCRLQLAVNLEQFKNKWGREQAARYRLPEGSVVSSPSSVVKEKDAEVAGTRLRTTDHPEKGTGPLNSGVLSPFPNRVSLVMMVKNEEENLPGCLESVAGMFQDIVIVDTGSTDRTKEIAHQFGARVFDFPWVDSFAAARNEGIRHAQGRASSGWMPMTGWMKPIAGRLRT
jgi:hypothetical protein